MADYGIGRTGGSLRDALNALYPMTGLGNYSTEYPPQTGAPQPSGPVPMPQPRPQLPPGALGMAPPGAGGPQGLPPGVGMGPPPGAPPGYGPIPGSPGLGLQGGLRPQVSGGMNVPLGPNTQMFAGGQFGTGRNYAADLGLQGGLRRQF